MRPLYERLVPTMERAAADFELIFSCDPCTDRTEEVIAISARRIRASRCSRLSRRFGQPAATMAGLRMSSGDACVVIDCDLQDPPELIAEMIERWREGFDVVYAQRRSREGETLVKRIVSACRVPRDQADRRRRDPAQHRRLPAHEPPRRRRGARA